MSTIAELEARVRQSGVDVEVERHRDVQRPDAMSAAQERHRQAKAALAAARENQMED